MSSEQISTAGDAPVSKVRHSRLYYLCHGLLWLFMGLQPVGLLWLLLFPDSLSDVSSDPLWGIRDLAELNLWQRITMTAVGSATVAMMMLAAWNMRTVAMQFARGLFFSALSVQATRRMALLLAFFPLVKMVEQAILSVVMTIDRGPGEKMLVINTSNHDLAALLVGIMMLLFAEALAHAKAQREELEEIV